MQFTKVSLKGVIAGTATFIGLVGILNIYLNYFGGPDIRLITYWMHLIAWVIPGYIAAAVSRTNGVIHGSIVGLIISVLSVGALALLSIAFPNGSDSQGTLEIGMQISVRATLLCGLGGLLWEIQKYLTPK